MRSQDREPLFDSDEELTFFIAAETNSDLTTADLTKNLDINRSALTHWRESLINMV